MANGSQCEGSVVPWQGLARRRIPGFGSKILWRCHFHIISFLHSRERDLACQNKSDPSTITSIFGWYLGLLRFLGRLHIRQTIQDQVSFTIFLFISSISFFIFSYNSTSENNFIHVALQSLCTLAAEIKGVQALLDTLNNGLDITVVGDNDFYSQRAQVSPNFRYQSYHTLLPS